MGGPKREASEHGQESAPTCRTKLPSFSYIPELHRWCYASATCPLHKGLSGSNGLLAQLFTLDQRSVTKVRAMLGFLRRIFRRLFCQICFSLYPAMVCLHLKYCVWSDWNVSNSFLFDKEGCEEIALRPTKVLEDLCQSISGNTSSFVN